VALMSQGITDSSLKYHIMNAKNQGVTQEEMAAVITHVAFYVGWPKAWAVTSGYTCGQQLAELLK